MRKGALFLLGLLIFVSFVLFSYFVHRDLFTAFDFDTTVRLQDNIPRRFDSFFSSFSLLGSLEVLSLLLLATLLIKRNLKLIFLIPFSFVMLHVFELYGKVFVEHHGPPFMFFRYDINFLFPSSYVQPGFSYPSGHSARAAFISVIFIFFILRSKWSSLAKVILISILIAFDITMFVSRIYLGEHWTTDVIGGALLGAALAIIPLSFFATSKKSKIK